MACKYIYNNVEYKDKQTFIEEFVKPNFINQPKTLRVQELQQPDFLKNIRKDKQYLKSLGLTEEQQNFLGLLFGNDEKWVRFFINSLIQNAAKKGYEKVLFPKGDTAAKIEGHETIEEFKKNKEDRIKKLEGDGRHSIGVIVNGQDQGILDTFKTKEQALEMVKNANDSLSQDATDEYYYIEGSLNDDEIKTLREQIHNAETGKIQLSPIAGFYENVVTNVLKKQGYNPVEITDEYGNKWNEVEITPESSSEILLQKTQGEYTDVVSPFERMTKEDQVAFEKTIRDLSARIADRIGMPYKVINDKSQKYKGRLVNGEAEINLAYATLDTPIHEILGHPIIRNILKNNKTLYTNLLKELETGTGKEVLDRVKRDYNKKYGKLNGIHYHNDLEIKAIDGVYKSTAFEFNNEKYMVFANNNIYKISSNGPISIREKLSKEFLNKLKEIRSVVKDIIKYGVLEGNYTLEEQQEEAIVELLGLMTAEKLDAVKDGKLISLLKKLLKEMKAFMRSLINQKEVEIDKLPDNMTLGDIANLLAYSNSKLILPGNEVVYTTRDNQTFKTYQEASNYISELAKNVEDVDLDSIKIEKKTVVGKIDPITGKKIKSAKFNEGSGSYFSPDENQYEPGEPDTFDLVFEDGTKNTVYEEDLYINQSDETRMFYLQIRPFSNGIKNFIEENKEFEQSKEIIEEYKKVNNIQYNPEEVYSRGRKFYHKIGAFVTSFDPVLMMQNYLAYLQDYERVGAELIINGVTRTPDSRVSFENSDIQNSKDLRIVIYPTSEDIKWVTRKDAASGTTRQGDKNVSEIFGIKENEIAGIGETKAPTLNKLKLIEPSLASAINAENRWKDTFGETYNEVALRLTGTNFRFEYDSKTPYQQKKMADKLNAVLDEKFGKIKEPKIYNNPIQPTQTNKTLKESIDSIKNKITKRSDATLLAKTEYTDQALINTKVTALKKVPKKYPRSLIRSEVRPYKSTDKKEYLFGEDDLPFQLVGGKELTPKQQLKESLNQRQEVFNSELYGNQLLQKVKKELGSRPFDKELARELESKLKSLYPGVSLDYTNTLINLSEKARTNLFNQEIDNIILGQANIKAMSVLIDAVNQRQDTLPHEYAHHYIAWFRDSEIVQKGIEEFGSEESLVQAIGEAVVNRKGKAYTWWEKFVNFIISLFSDKRVIDNLVAGFLEAKNLNDGTVISKSDSTSLSKRASGVFNQLVGVKSKLTLEQKDSFVDAIISESFKINPETIWNEYKWARGYDGKWRTELPYGKMINKNQLKINTSHKLGDIYDAPSLYKAYPDIKDTKVQITENSISYNRKTDVIKIDSSLDTTSLIHEIQHKIQAIEDFNSGANSFIRDIMIYNKFNRISKKIRQKKITNPLSLNKDLIPIKYSKKTRKYYIENNNFGIKFRPNGNAEIVLNSVSSQLNSKAKDILNSKYASDASFNMYTRISGEVEARNAEFRYKNESLKSPIETQDIPASEQIGKTNTVNSAEEKELVVDYLVDKVLREDDIRNYKKFFLTPDGLALIANRINQLAKTKSRTWYDYKPYLLKYIAEVHPRTWVKDNIFYIETPYGQVSFHIFDQSFENTLSNKGREWSKENTQERSRELIQDYIDDIEESKKEVLNKMHTRSTSIDEVLASNNKPSKLYVDILNDVIDRPYKYESYKRIAKNPEDSREVALAYWAHTYTEKFNNSYVGKRDENGEPLLSDIREDYVEDNTVNGRIKSILNQIDQC